MEITPFTASPEQQLRSEQRIAELEQLNRELRLSRRILMSLFEQLQNEYARRSEELQQENRRLRRRIRVLAAQIRHCQLAAAERKKEPEEEGSANGER